MKNVATREDLAKVRTEIANVETKISELRTEMVDMKAELIKWMFIAIVSAVMISNASVVFVSKLIGI